MTRISKKEIATMGEQIYEAEKSRSTIAPLTKAHPDLTAEEAYQIQLAYVERRLADGAKVVEILMAGYLSAAEGRAVMLPMARRGDAVTR